jgi:hypothetical protein
LSLVGIGPTEDHQAFFSVGELDVVILPFVGPHICLLRWLLGIALTEVKHAIHVAPYGVTVLGEMLGLTLVEWTHFLDERS